MNKPLTFGSLFAGIGGLDLGFERSGMECRWQVEIDDYASRVLAKHWPNARRWDDVRTWPQPDTERVDVICGGFPCQDISYAGLGAGLDGERSGLFFEAVRVVQQLRPRVVVLENVAALLTRGLDRVLGTLAQVGYDAEWHCIPAAAVGAPHIRDRVFIIGWRLLADSKCPKWWPCGSGGREMVGKDCRISSERKEDTGGPRISGEDVSDTNSSGLQGRPGIELPKREAQLSSWSRSSLRRFRESVGVEQWGSEPDVGRVASGVSSRVDRLKCLGNAVVPQVAQFVGQRVLQIANAQMNDN